MAKMTEEEADYWDGYNHLKGQRRQDMDFVESFLLLYRDSLDH